MTYCLTLLLLAAEPAGAALTTELIFPLHAEHNHAPGIAELPGGELFATWYRGSGERSADDVAVYAARKQPGTDRWSEPFRVRGVAEALAAFAGGWPLPSGCAMRSRMPQSAANSPSQRPMRRSISRNRSVIGSPSIVFNPLEHHAGLLQAIGDLSQGALFWSRP